jgi:hypothetical protein
VLVYARSQGFFWLERVLAQSLIGFRRNCGVYRMMVPTEGTVSLCRGIPGITAPLVAYALPILVMAYRETRVTLAALPHQIASGFFRTYLNYYGELH